MVADHPGLGSRRKASTSGEAKERDSQTDPPLHFDKIPLYNGANLINGFESISINTPAEVIAYET